VYLRVSYNTATQRRTALRESQSNVPITELLANLRSGDPRAEAILVPRIYDELRRLARAQMRRERGNHTLQPTALVNEAYERLIQASQQGVAWQSRVHFFAMTAQVMRHILVDYARAKSAQKRGAFRQQVTLEDDLHASEGQSLDVLALNEALERLAKLDQRQSRVVELRFFGGLTFEEIAEVQEVAVRTVKRDWTIARSWLYSQLSPGR
jgi:RNA polymerase sigma-70 factor, ECF subfamily